MEEVSNLKNNAKGTLRGTVSFLFFTIAMIFASCGANEHPAIEIDGVYLVITGDVEMVKTIDLCCKTEDAVSYHFDLLEESLSQNTPDTLAVGIKTVLSKKMEVSYRLVNDSTSQRSINMNIIYLNHDNIVHSKCKNFKLDAESGVQGRWEYPLK